MLTRNGVQASRCAESAFLSSRLTNTSPKVVQAVRYHTTGASTAGACTVNSFPSLPKRYLRNLHESNYDAATFQRTDVAFDERSGKLISRTEDSASALRYVVQSWRFDGDGTLVVEWGDGRILSYPAEVLNEHLSLIPLEPASNGAPWISYHGQRLWKDMSPEFLRSDVSISYSGLVASSDAPTNNNNEALQTLHRYGVLLVTDTPLNDQPAIAALARAVSGGTNTPTEDSCGPMPTLYGTVWSTVASDSSGSTADSAYGHAALPLHTDMTYLATPPGLQIFSLQNPAARGGETVLADGVGVAWEMRREHPELWEVLRNTERRYRCVDTDTGWHLRAGGPIFQTCSRNSNRVTAVRHNDLDRLPDVCETERDYERLEEAHTVLDEMLSRNDVRCVIGLQPGETIVVVNHRVLHGRQSFVPSVDSPRRIMGCYVSRDDLDSRFRTAGVLLD